jgi:hypothetical protein
MYYPQRGRNGKDGMSMFLEKNISAKIQQINEAEKYKRGARWQPGLQKRSGDSFCCGEK